MRSKQSQIKAFAINEKYIVVSNIKKELFIYNYVQNDVIFIKNSKPESAVSNHDATLSN